MTYHTSETLRADREALGGLLALADPEQLCALADSVLAGSTLAGAAGSFQITRAPTTGVLVSQVREPIASHRFIAGDLVASTAEVVLDEAAGWGMRLGDDRAAALAQAVLDAEVLRRGGRTDAVLSLALGTAERLRAERVAEWDRLTPTIVEFEEIA